MLLGFGNPQDAVVLVRVTKNRYIYFRFQVPIFYIFSIRIKLVKSKQLLLGLRQFFVRSDCLLSEIFKHHPYDHSAHSIIYSSNAEADKQFFKDVLKFPNVDVGRGWLIFALPPSEIAVHPADESGLHEFILCATISNPL